VLPSFLADDLAPPDVPPSAFDVMLDYFAPSMPDRAATTDPDPDDSVPA
jgi:hypothetical protein